MGDGDRPSLEDHKGLYCLFGLKLNVPVDSYVHVGTVSSP